MSDFRDREMTPVGTVTEVLGGQKARVYNILSARDFGVVCPGLFEGNGSAYRLALHLTALIEGQDQLARDFNGYQIWVTVAGEEYTGLAELHRALKNAHDRAQENSNEV